MKGEKKRDLNIADFDAVILDLDGVITKTARVHALAWKRMFDRFLEDRKPSGNGKSLACFDKDKDYRDYVDGKPRYEGVKSFLDSRGIELPQGDPEDPPDRNTICGLGNRKNEIFLDVLREKGAEVFDDTVHQVRKWRDCGLKTAVVSSSSNCAEVLEVAGLTDLFEVRVDGVLAQELRLEGKPAPDTFLEAAQRLGVEPSRTVLFEDAGVGVRAGRAGDFGLVVGVDRKGEGEALKEEGADVVVQSLLELKTKGSRSKNARRRTYELPSALETEEIRKRLYARKPAFFLDYDGTLTPIVSRPELARLADDMREVLKKLASFCSVAVVSGRDMKNVKELVGLEELVYAGSHGFDITGPNGLEMQLEEAKHLLPDFDEAERALRRSVGFIDGAQVERKRFSIAVHYRNAAREDVGAVEKAVDEALEKHPGLHKSGGKKIFELRPDLDWNKGDAVLWLLENLKLSLSRILPLYLGDDLTDEDAFQALAGRGTGIVVGSPSECTYAEFSLKNAGEVESFLKEMTSILEMKTR